MTAYELLDIEDINLEYGYEETDVDDYVKGKVQTKMNAEVEKLIAMIGEHKYTQEQLDDMSLVIGNMCMITLAYDALSNREKRANYNARGKKDIIKEFEKVVKENFINSSLIRGKNAYQVLCTRNLIEHPEQDIDDYEVLRNTMKFLEASIKNKPCMKPGLDNDHTGTDMQKTILQMYSYFCANTKIRTKVDRQIYNDKFRREAYYRDVSKEANTEYINSVNTSYTDPPRIYNIDNPLESEYSSIRISEIQKINYRILNEEKRIRKYLVEKTKTDGTIIKNIVFSNIDFSEMAENPIYAAKVERILLSDQNIYLGKTYLSGYVGDLIGARYPLNEGRLKLSETQAGLCMYLKEKERDENKRRNSNSAPTKHQDAKSAPTDPGDR